MRTRSERRFFERKQKAKAKHKVVENMSFGRMEDLSEHDLNVRVGRYAHTRTPCSCWMCRSPRKVYKNGRQSQTLQEIRQYMRVDD
jgi:hypothetical protein